MALPWEHSDDSSLSTTTRQHPYRYMCPVQPTVSEPKDATDAVFRLLQQVVALQLDSVRHLLGCCVVCQVTS
jgi:hypothetical protein